jgi:hypothetical protein
LAHDESVAQVFLFYALHLHAHVVARLGHVNLNKIRSKIVKWSNHIVADLLSVNEDFLYSYRHVIRHYSHELLLPAYTAFNLKQKDTEN